MSTTRWHEWTSVALGFYLLVSPFLAFGDVTALAILTAEVGGLLVLGAAVRTLIRPANIRARWAQTGIGALLTLAALGLGQDGLTAAALNTYVVGFAVAALALSTIDSAHRGDAESTPDRESARAR